MLGTPIMKCSEDENFTTDCDNSTDSNEENEEYDNEDEESEEYQDDRYDHIAVWNNTNDDQEEEGIVDPHWRYQFCTIMVTYALLIFFVIPFILCLLHSLSS